MNILYYYLLQYLPATLVFLFVLVVQIDVTSAPMAHYVLFCNALAVYMRSTPSLFTGFDVSGNTYRYILRAFLTLNSNMEL